MKDRDGAGRFVDQTSEPCTRCGIGEKVVYPSQTHSWCRDCIRVEQRHTRRKSHYGITKEEYENKLEEQNGRCAICNGTNKNGRALAVDHDHETGDIRGLLCGQCNVVLGMAHDKVDVLASAISYLKEYDNG